MADQGAEDVAVCHDQDGVPGVEVGHDRRLPIGEQPGQDVPERLVRRYVAEAGADVAEVIAFALGTAGGS
jgi:hypothetical protein